MTKEQLENKLYERMSAENETFLTDLKAKPVDEIISHAYEIACRDNLLMLFEDETSLSERQLTVLNEFEHPLSQLYTDWLSRDTDEMDAFRDSIACCADDILRKRQRDTSHGDIHTSSFRGIYSSFVHQKILNRWQINQYT